jgi:small subunit ribosomal protein S20
MAIKTRLRHLVRAVREALTARDANTAVSRLVDASRALDKAATKGVVHRRNASRRIARLTHAVAQLKTGS